MQQRGFRYFGLQFYGECWSGDHSEDLFASRTSDKCIGHKYARCDDNALDACTGEASHNYVYEIVREGNYHCISVDPALHEKYTFRAVINFCIHLQQTV